MKKTEYQDDVTGSLYQDSNLQERKRDQILHDPNPFKLSTRSKNSRGRSAFNINQITKGEKNSGDIGRIQRAAVMPPLAVVHGITRNLVRSLPYVTWSHTAREIRLLISLPKRREVDLRKLYARVTVESIVLQYLHVDESAEKEEYDLTDMPELAFKRQCLIRPGSTEVRSLGPLIIELRLFKDEKQGPTATAYPFKEKHQGWLQPDIVRLGSELEDSSESEMAGAKGVKGVSGAERRINTAALATHPDSSFTSPAESSDDGSEEAGAFWA